LTTTYPPHPTTSVGTGIAELLALVDRICRIAFDRTLDDADVARRIRDVFADHDRAGPGDSEALVDVMIREHCRQVLVDAILGRAVAPARGPAAAGRPVRRRGGRAGRRGAPGRACPTAARRRLRGRRI
jgi:hypothetical protein